MTPAPKPAPGSAAFQANGSLLLMLPALLPVALLYVIPLLRLTAVSFGEHHFSWDAYGELFGPWGYIEIMWRTFRLSIAVVAWCLLLGYPIGYVLAFSAPRYRALLCLLVLLPYWSSVLVRNFAWIYLLREGGVLSRLVGHFTATGEPAQLLYNSTGVVIGMVSTLLPFMVLPVFLAIDSQDRGLRETAGSLGASPSRVFLAVTLPLSRTGICAGSLLVFLTSVGFFITPALLGGGRVLTAATFIARQIEEFVNWPLAAAAAVTLLLTVIGIMAFYRRITLRIPGADHASG